jgi:hypothetical protein
MIDNTAVFILSVLIGIVAVIGLISLSYRRAKEEKGLTPLYEERCKAGGLLLGNPHKWSRRVSLYENFLVVTMFWPKVIRYEDVHSISLQRSLFSKKYVSLEYKDGLFEGTFDFFAKQPENALAILQSRCPLAKGKDMGF